MDVNMKVLVVDDFKTMRMIFRKILKELGFTNISEADDGKTALEELRKEKFDLVLCDWNMPEMPGIELLNTIRSDDELKDLPFVMVTAEGQKDTIIAAVEAGINAYILKPLTAEKVSQKITKVFSG